MNCTLNYKCNLFKVGRFVKNRLQNIYLYVFKKGNRIKKNVLLQKKY